MGTLEGTSRPPERHQRDGSARSVRPSPLRRATSMFDEASPASQFLIVAAATATAQCLTTELNLRFSGLVGSAMPARLLPTIGIATAVMLAVPRRVRWAPLLGTTICALGVLPLRLGLPVESLLPLTAAALIQSVLVVAGLQWLTGSPAEVRRTGQAVAFILVTLVATVSAATIVKVSYDIGFLGLADRIGMRWREWVAGEFTGTAMTVPLVLSWRSPGPRLTTWPKRAEAILAGATLGVTLLLSATESFAFFYFAAPIVAWLAIRFGPRLGSSGLVVAMLSLSAIAFSGRGPFSTTEGSEGGLLAFNMAMVAAGIVLIALAQQASDDRYNLSATLEALPDTVALIGRDGRIVEIWGPRDNPLPRAVLRSFVDDAGSERGGTLQHSVADAILEHSWTTARNGQQLHLIRDVTVAATAEEEQRRRREEVELARLAEQRRLGIQLHDGPIQDLAATLLRMGHLLETDDPQEELSLAETRLSSTIDDLRTVANRLIPPDVGAGSVGEALRDFATHIFDVDVVCQVDDQSWAHSSTVESEALFLVGREALANAAFHADPTKVKVRLAALMDRALLAVADDGPGLDGRLDHRRHLGLQIMRERVESLGGRLELTTSDWGGLLVVASIPRPGPRMRHAAPDGDVIDLDQGLGAPSTFAS